VCVCVCARACVCVQAGDWQIDGKEGVRDTLQRTLRFEWEMCGDE
jgi:hypothetical protein